MNGNNEITDHIIPGMDEILKIVYLFISKPESEPFRDVVDWEGLGLNDYPDIVKNPMDLGTLKRNIQRGEYKSLEEAVKDMRLIWTNCMTYNQDGSEYYHLADTFAKLFEEKYAELRKSLGIEEVDPDRIPSLEEKIQMTYDLFKIDSTQLGKLLTMIEKSCPRAILRETVHGTEEALVNIDYLTPTCFHEVADYIKSCNVDSKSSGTGNKKKRSSSSQGSGSHRKSSRTG